MWWIVLALLAAVCTSLTTIFAKVGIKNVNSNFATAYRTFIVIFCAIIISAIKGNLNSFSLLTTSNWIFLILSGLMTGLSWLCYFKALKLANVNKVAPIDKCSFILTSILFLIFFFDDTTKNGNALTISMLFVSMALMMGGTILMVYRKSDKSSGKIWIIFALLSAVFASLVSLFVKIGLQGIPSDFGTLIRTIIVFVFAALIVIFKKDYKGLKNIDFKSWIFLTLSGLATGGAWLLEYEALNIVNSNPVTINAIGKFSILITILFSLIFLKEKMNKKEILGLAILTSGIILITVFSL